MGNAVTVTPGAAFGTAASAILNFSASDASGFVTVTTGTIPAAPYLLFTLQWGGSWAAAYSDFPVVSAFPCANPGSARSASFMGSVAALGPFYTIPNSLFTQTAVYCTNAPAAAQSYDIGYIAVQGP